MPSSASRCDAARGTATVAGVTLPVPTLLRPPAATESWVRPKYSATVPVTCTRSPTATWDTVDGE
ncbi:hypothetical protein SRABI128_05898 [Microbacterium sp. Bi128]|nr:hypothetical protein SRABI128_05898 [Microbacterium sp. Bi128]